jgi:hypothetical protein
MGSFSRGCLGIAPPENDPLRVPASAASAGVPEGSEVLELELS